MAVGAGVVVVAVVGVDLSVSAAYEAGMLITNMRVKANFFMLKF